MNMASQLILTIPCSKEYPLNNLIIIRNNFQLLFADTLKKIQELRINLMNLKVNNLIKIKLNEFNESIDQDIDKLQIEIDNNIYIQGIKNSDPNYQEVNIKLGIMPYESLLNVFAIKKILTEDKLYKIKSKLSEYLVKDSCEIFLFYDIKTNIDE